MNPNFVNFDDLAIGEHFRWKVPLVWNGMILDGAYVKGSTDTFGTSADWQPWEAGSDRVGEVVRISGEAA